MKKISVLFHELNDVRIGAVEHLAQVIELHVDDSDVHLVEGDRLQHRELGAFDVQRKVVDGRIVQSQQ